MTDFYPSAPIPLTARQRQVVALAAAGHPNTTIARNRAHAVTQALRAGELT